MKIILLSKNAEKTKYELRKCKPDELVMMVDLDRCITCGSCELACQAENAFNMESAKSIRFTCGNSGSNDGDSSIILPLACRHCKSPCDYYSQYNFWIICPKARSQVECQQCDYCLERQKRGYWPACATRCTMKAIFFATASDMAFVLEERRLRELGDVEICS